MKIAVCQMRCVLGKIEENLEKIKSFIKKASDENCEYVVFPEMADIGYSMEYTAHVTEATYKKCLLEISKSTNEHSIGVFCGLSERLANGKLYNTITCFNKQGDIAGNYRKVHLFKLTNEHLFFEPGERLVNCKIGEYNAGLVICYDIRFPEHARTLTLSGSNIIIICAAWPIQRIDNLLSLAVARAIENQCYVLLSNRTGTDGNCTFGGSSCFIGPDGKILKKTTDDLETLISHEINMSYVSKVREGIAVFDDRRDTVYSSEPWII